jgi:hypothetical protein
MDVRSFDDVAKRMATTAPRRGILRGLGALGVGSLGVLGLAEAGSAQVHAESCRSRCRRRCEDRKPRCKDRCIDRRCR